jgi:ATP-dependent DNA helicase RecQ
VANKRTIEEVARERCGFESLYPVQVEAIESIIDGKDTLVVMPTGAGKSAIYQIAASIIPGATVVVSPLIALQYDQVESIDSLDLGAAAAINSSLRTAEKAATFAKLQAAELEFLFLAPEQFNNEQILEDLKAVNVSLLVVDEAHCISEWGHDFRPDYLKLGAVIEDLGHPPVLALTATASPPVREEIAERLGMRQPDVIVHGFDRPNIWLGVERFAEEWHKQQTVIDRVVEAARPGIIYAATRRRAEELAAALADRGVSAVHYHAGLAGADRERTHDAFMVNGLEVIVATTAFGMGIDKPDVRFVYHYDIPGSVDAYYQEIGRAGRNGEAAEAILFYRAEDLGIRRYFAGGGQYDEDEVSGVVALLQKQSRPMTIPDLAEQSDISSAKLQSILANLQSEGTLHKDDGGVITWIGNGGGDAVAETMQAQQRRRSMESSRIEMMRQYAELNDCRREFLLNYFGEAYEDPCDACDNCDAGAVIVEESADHPFPLNSRVCHEKWGEGLVMRYEDDKITVLFNEVGYKTLSQKVVLGNGLLRAV